MSEEKKIEEVTIEEKKEDSIEPKKKTKKGSNSGKKKGRKLKRRLKELILKTVLLIVGIILLTTVFFSVHLNRGNGMYPSLRDGDLVITYRLTRTYMSDHVWAYKYDGETYFGRIVGVPGDVIDMTGDGYYRINGNVPFEDQFYETNPSSGQGVKYPYTVPEGSVFLLGDYRLQTDDSRNFGAIPTEDLIGEVVLTFRRRGF